MKPSVVFVTDPMCSWCWGMTPAVEHLIGVAGERFEFDVRLGGINTTSSLPVGAYGRKMLSKLWHEVAAVTGQPFGHRVEPGTVYNSTLPCCAVEAARDVIGAPPFELLHALQRHFFVDGANVNDEAALLRVAGAVGIDPAALKARLYAVEVRERVRWSFNTARRYGTQALPSVLVSKNGYEFRLLAGGYVGADVLLADLDAWRSAL